MEDSGLFGTVVEKDDWKKKSPNPDDIVDEADIPDDDIDPEFGGES